MAGWRKLHWGYQGATAGRSFGRLPFLETLGAFLAEFSPELSRLSWWGFNFFGLKIQFGLILENTRKFAAGRSEALKRFLVEDGIGRDARFWRLAQSLSALYPPATDEKRWVDGVLARKGLGY